MEQALETPNFVRCWPFSCWIVRTIRRCVSWGWSSQGQSQIMLAVFQYLRWTFNPRYEKSIIVIRTQISDVSSLWLQSWLLLMFKSLWHNPPMLQACKSSDFYDVLLLKCLWTCSGWLIGLVPWIPSRLWLPIAASYWLQTAVLLLCSH